MNTNSNAYTLIYATIMVVIVAFLLSFVSGVLQEKQKSNVEIDKKKQILSSLQIDMSGKDINALYNEYIVGAMIIDADNKVLSESKEEVFEIDIIKENSKDLKDRQLPIYVAKVDGATKYIISLYGAGLWGPIWGYIALNDDRNTVFGVFYSHASETPGLGSEITASKFKDQFLSKHILNDQNEFVSIAVMKTGSKADGQEQVDALSGGTITSKGVEAMLKSSLSQYTKFFQDTKTEGGAE